MDIVYLRNSEISARGGFLHVISAAARVSAARVTVMNGHTRARTHTRAIMLLGRPAGRHAR